MKPDPKASELAYMSAGRALAHFRAAQLSPVELLDALLSRAEAMHRGPINATVAIYADSARERAREAERRYRDGTARALEGLPVAIKEETAVTGWRRTIGSWLHDELSEHNHPIVDKLIEAGAIPFMQTTVPEFCVIGQTLSNRYGVTRNPWNPALTCGGSSGGSGAALAAGLTPLATGSDMAGSTRIPAALQGLYGYKPPFGRLAPTPSEELFAFAVEGPLARDIEDLRLMQNAIAGPHPSSYVGMPFEPLAADPPSITGMRIGLAWRTGSRGLCPDTRSNMRAAADVLQRCGAVVEEIDLDWDNTEIAEVLIEGIFGIFFKEYLEALGETALTRATPYLRWLMGRYQRRPNSIAQAAALATRLHQELHHKLWGRGLAALLCPTVFTTEIPADLDLTQQRRIRIEGHDADSYLGWVGTPPFNLLNRYPALAVPTGLARTGVPTSMQIVAPSYQDATVFAIAQHFARAAELALYRSQFPILD